MTVEQGWAQAEKIQAVSESDQNTFAQQGFSEAYDYMQAQSIAKALEKNPDLQAADESLKKMSERETEMVVDMVNQNLAKDGSKLKLSLRLGEEGCMDIFRTFNLKLMEDGKEIDHDKWRGKTLPGRTRPVDR